MLYYVISGRLGYSYIHICIYIYIYIYIDTPFSFMAQLIRNSKCSSKVGNSIISYFSIILFRRKQKKVFKILQSLLIFSFTPTSCLQRNNHTILFLVRDAHKQYTTKQDTNNNQAGSKMFHRNVFAKMLVYKGILIKEQFNLPKAHFFHQFKWILMGISYSAQW